MGTERWTAVEMDVTATSDGAFEGVIGLAVQRPGENITLMPVSVGVTLFGEWRDCEVDPESWQAEFSPAVHPRLDGRSWDLSLESADVIDDGDGGAVVRVEYAAFGGDATATLIVTADIVPGCGGEPAQDEDDGTVTGTAQAQPDDSESEADEGGAEPTRDDDIDPDGTAQPETGEGDDETEPQTTEPESQPVQFRRWNHQALIDLPLWSHCPPEDWGSIGDRLDGYDITWANWDTTAFETDGHRIAVGYLTDEQIDRWLPGGGITAADALANLYYSEAADSTLIWRGIVTLHLMDTPSRLPTLKAAMQSRGVYSENLVQSLEVTRHGIDGSGAWPADVHVGLLLTDWVRWRYAWPPTTAEPVAWPLRSLFEARESTCAGEALIAMCASDETPPAMLAPNHPIGRVLRSLACAE